MTIFKLSYSKKTNTHLALLQSVMLNLLLVTHCWTLDWIDMSW